jgi:tetratricopeptide (TPR) repeat protein
MRSRWHFWRGAGKHAELALNAAEKALLLDPENSETMAQLSFCHMTQVWTGRAKDVGHQIREAVRFAEQAVRLDDGNPNAHFTYGTALSIAQDIKGAIAAERQALQLNPNFAGALGELGRLLAFDGQSEEARQVSLKAIELSPTDPQISLWVRNLAIAAFSEQDFEGAAAFAAEAASKRPDWFFHYTLLAACRALSGQTDAAKQAFAEAQRLLGMPYSVEALRAGHPFTDVAHSAKLAEGLEQSGWIEGERK